MAEKNERKEAHAQNSTVPPYERGNSNRETIFDLARVVAIHGIYCKLSEG